ncbi:hypothetical protein P692DRAFT_201808648 [Suillus brevipes Sb2]|nr:hypothetical protein P692DRAFT_201808648 [Suillus brevipes Sb2]
MASSGHVVWGSFKDRTANIENQIGFNYVACDEELQDRRGYALVPHPYGALAFGFPWCREPCQLGHLGVRGLGVAFPAFLAVFHIVCQKQQPPQLTRKSTRGARSVPEARPPVAEIAIAMAVTVTVSAAASPTPAPAPAPAPAPTPASSASSLIT